MLHADEVEKLLKLRRSVAPSEDFRCMRGFDIVWFNRPYDRLYLVYDAAKCLRELYFEGRHRQGSQHLRFLRWYKRESFALSHYDRAGLYASVPEVCCMYKPQNAQFCDPAGFLYLTG